MSRGKFGLSSLFLNIPVLPRLKCLLCGLSQRGTRALDASELLGLGWVLASASVRKSGSRAAALHAVSLEATPGEVDVWLRGVRVLGGILSISDKATAIRLESGH